MISIISQLWAEYHRLELLPGGQNTQIDATDIFLRWGIFPTTRLMVWASIITMGRLGQEVIIYFAEHISKLQSDKKPHIWQIRSPKPTFMI